MESSLAVLILRHLNPTPGRTALRPCIVCGLARWCPSPVLSARPVGTKSRSGVENLLRTKRSESGQSRSKSSLIAIRGALLTQRSDKHERTKEPGAEKTRKCAKSGTLWFLQRRLTLLNCLSLLFSLHQLGRTLKDCTSTTFSFPRRSGIALLGLFNGIWVLLFLFRTHLSICASLGLRSCPHRDISSLNSPFCPRFVRFGSPFAVLVDRHSDASSLPFCPHNPFLAQLDPHCLAFLFFLFFSSVGRPHRSSSAAPLPSPALTCVSDHCVTSSMARPVSTVTIDPPCGASLLFVFTSFVSYTSLTHPYSRSSFSDSLVHLDQT